MENTSGGWTKLLSTLGMALGTTLAAALGTETARQMASGIKRKEDGSPGPAGDQSDLEAEVARLRRESDASRARADRLELELAQMREALKREKGPTS